MLHSKKLWLPLLLILNIASLAIGKDQTFRLSQFDHLSAAVLPTFTHRNVKWAILSREAYGRTKKYTYDSFSGGKDAGETHPIQTAAHEFLQEAILELVLDWNLEDVEKFIDPKNEYTWVVAAYEKDANPHNPKSRTVRNVTYIVNFNKYKTKLFDQFYDAREQEMARYEAAKTPGKYRTTTEKDRLAKVRWRDLEKAIVNQEHTNDPVTVTAYVLDPETQDFTKETITLRPILVMTLRPLFLGGSYEQGENEKIRYYDLSFDLSSVALAKEEALSEGEAK
ncbi:MAG TPA: hypothetical protein VHX42_03395 [Candidatus Babeliales bacterium]|jgi:hypothetical protein|nr:hypothetical protein [Candidatus Babeliales bacterium]